MVTSSICYARHSAVPGRATLRVEPALRGVHWTPLHAGSVARPCTAECQAAPWTQASCARSKGRGRSPLPLDSFPRVACEVRLAATRPGFAGEITPTRAFRHALTRSRLRFVALPRSHATIAALRAFPALAFGSRGSSRIRAVRIYKTKIAALHQARGDHHGLRSSPLQAVPYKKENITITVCQILTEVSIETSQDQRVKSP